ncbi:hypothetical protein DICVIV_11253 [Dictyocaulus viviparus]|uniref:Uncharacterized protein n=1 Tax=Dictyocaulus viviparus TaxID=29172 RepID=A0A0D8XKB3_DICVI|nr:hypothetical protein DICVIV_11253 [Dictyocaulus viviparus]
MSFCCSREFSTHLEKGSRFRKCIALSMLPTGIVFSMLRAFGAIAHLVRYTYFEGPHRIIAIHAINQTRLNSSANPQRKGFIAKLVDNVKEELEKNKELQEHQRMLRKRMEELNDSEALKDARRKFNMKLDLGLPCVASLQEIVEKETLKSSELVKAKLDELSEQISKMIKEVQKTEAGKKITAAGAEALKQARFAAEHVEKLAEKVGDTEVYKQVSTLTKNLDI